MHLHTLEIASRQAWPALHEQELPFGVLRFAQGVSRRANSLNLFAGVRVERVQVCAVTEEFFSRYELPAIVRVLQLNGAADHGELDAFLGEQGYSVVTPTSVMLCEAGGVASAITGSANDTGTHVSMPLWLDVWHHLLKKSSHQREVHRAMLQRLHLPHQCSVQYDRNGQPLSCGMAVSSGALVGIYGVATAKEHRNKGFARALVRQLVQWGWAKGAKYAYLQVERSNFSAMAAYKGLGFREHYGYWYREKLPESSNMILGAKSNMDNQMKNHIKNHMKNQVREMQ